VKNVWWYSAPAVVLAVVVVATAAVAASAPPSIEQIVKEMAHQNTAHIDLEFTYEAVPSRGKPAGPCRYVRTPDVLYRRFFEVEYASKREGLTGVADVRGRDYTADGAYTSGYIRTYLPMMCWSGRDKIETILMPMYPRTDDPSTNFLVGWMKYGKVAPRMDSVDGHKCWKMTVTDTGKSGVKRYEFWLDPSIGFNPRRVSCYVKGGEFFHVYSREYQQIAEGLWFPKQQLMHFAFPRDKIDEKHLYKATQLRGDRKIPKDDYLGFKKGTKVTVVGKDLQTTLFEYTQL
jgi:hypothetical protein